MPVEIISSSPIHGKIEFIPRKNIVLKDGALRYTAIAGDFNWDSEIKVPIAAKFGNKYYVAEMNPLFKDAIILAIFNMDTNQHQLCFPVKLSSAERGINELLGACLGFLSKDLDLSDQTEFDIYGLAK